MCEDNGGSLVSIRSSEENSWIVDTFLPPWNSSRNSFLYFWRHYFLEKKLFSIFCQKSAGDLNSADVLYDWTMIIYQQFFLIKSISQNILIAILLSRFMETLYLISLIVKIYFECALLTCRFLIRVTIYYKLHHILLYVSFWALHHLCFGTLTSVL